MSFLRKGILVSGGQLLSAALNMLTGIVYSRVLGPDGTGRLELFRSTATITTTIAALGLGHASIYFLNNRKVDHVAVTTNSFKIAVGLGVAVGLGLATSLLVFQNYFGRVPVSLALVFSAAVGVQMGTLILRPILVAGLAAARIASVDLISAILMLVGGSVLASFHLLNWQAAVVLVGLGFLSSFGMVWSYVRRNVDLRLRFDWVLLRQMLVYGVKLAAASTLYVLSFNITVMLLRYLRPSEFDAVGLYSRAVTICGLVTLVPGALGPLLYAKWSGVSGEDRTRQVEMAARMNSTYGIVAALGVVCAGKQIIWLMYGPMFVGAQQALQLLGPAVFFLTLFSVCGNVLAGDGRATISAYILAATLVVIAGVTYVAVPWWGIRGAAFGALCGNAFTAISSLAVCCKLYKINPLRCLFLRPSDLVYIRQAVIG